MKINSVFLLACLISVFSFHPQIAKADPSSDQPAPSAPVEKEWTLITFLNGHNSLDKYGSMNIKEMEKVGSSDQINVVVQWASLRAPKTKRIYIRQGSFDTIEELDRVDMGDAKNFVEFVNWAVAHYPAKHYFVEVWDHGSGWHFTGSKKGLKQSLAAKLHPYDISVDETSGHSISTEDLGKSLQQIAQTIGHKIDIYGSDACLMAMAEVMSEAKSSVEVFVGSQETEPDDGWPYGDLLRRWSVDPSISAVDVSKILVDEYVKAYSGGTYGNDDATLSAVDLSKFDNFEADFKRFSKYMSSLDAKTLKQISKVSRSAQYFTLDDYRDLGDFLRLLESSQLGLDVGEIQHLESSLNDVVIANNDSPAYHLAKGISFWLPTDSGDWNEYQARYRGLEFDLNTGWSQTLERIFSKN